MPTYQVRCVACTHDKWPVLPERPERYTCVLCRGGGSPEQRVKRQAAAKRAAASRRARRGTA